ncbi:MAG TPA: hypothetical protein PLK08_05585 [Phycisphaerae bacterium]|nr:hypothetical protein [Phycisphaerae bacterium]
MMRVVDGIIQLGNNKLDAFYDPFSIPAAIAYLFNNSGKIQIGSDWYLRNFGTLGTDWRLKAYNAVIDGNIPTENITVGTAQYAGCIGDVATSRRFVTDAVMPCALGYGSYTFELIWYDRGGRGDLESAQTSQSYYLGSGSSLWYIWHNGGTSNLCVSSANGCSDSGWTNGYWSGTGARHLLVSLNATTGLLTRCLNGTVTMASGQSPVTNTDSIQLSILGQSSGGDAYSIASASTVCQLSIWQGFAATSAQIATRKLAVYAGTADAVRWEL